MGIPQIVAWLKRLEYLIWLLYGRLQTAIATNGAFVSVKAFGAKGDGVTDDTIPIRNAIAALAGTGKWLWFPAGTYLMTKNATLPANILMWGYDAKIKTTVGGGNVIDNTIFTCVGNLTSDTINLSANVSAGDKTISVVGLTSGGKTVAKGSAICLHTTDYLQGSQYVVTNITGAGPFTLTLDRPSIYAYSTGNSEIEITTGLIPGIDIRGFTFTGVAQQYLELVTTWCANVQDITVDGSGGSLAGGIGNCLTSDAFCYRTTFRNIRVDGAGTASNGIGIEQNEDSWAEHCFVENVLISGIGIVTSANCGTYQCSAANCENGIFIANNGGFTGCRYITVVGGTVYGCSVEGVGVGSNSTEVSVYGVFAVGCNIGFSVSAFPNFPIDHVGFTDCISLNASLIGFQVLAANAASATVNHVSFTGCKSSGAAGGGFQLNASAGGTIANTTFVNCDASNTTGDGFQTTTSCTGTLMQNITASGNLGGADIETASDLTLDGFVASGGSGSASKGLIQSTAGRLIVRNADLTITNTVGGGFIGIYCNNSPAAVFDSVRVTLAAGGPASFAMSLDGTTKAYIQNFLFANPGAVGGCLGIAGNVSTVVRLGDDINVEAAATPLNLLGLKNFGTVALNGTTNVVIPFTDIKPSTENVYFTGIATNHSTASTPVVVSKTAGVGATVVGTNVGDTTVWNYVIR